MIQIGNHQRLVVLTGRGDDSHGGLARAGGPKDFDRLLQLPDPFLAAGVVEHHHEIGGGDRFQPPADDFPGNQQVAQADHGEVQHQRRPQGRGGGAGSRYTGNDLHGNVQVFGLGQFQGQPGHAVDAGVAGGDQRDHLACRGAVEGLPAALDFMRHAGSDKLLAAGQIGNRFQIGRIADDGLAFGNRLDRPQRAVLPAAGTYSNDIQLSRAIATVTPWSICLGSINCVLLPAKRAAGSATAGRSTFS